jgi:hypothetical protein
MNLWAELGRMTTLRDAFSLRKEASARPPAVGPRDVQTFFDVRKTGAVG